MKFNQLYMRRACVRSIHTDRGSTYICVISFETGHDTVSGGVPHVIGPGTHANDDGGRRVVSGLGVCCGRGERQRELGGAGWFLFQGQLSRRRPEALQNRSLPGVTA